MPVHLPTAAIGNGHMLATLGASGEIMTIFYPHTDFAQNVHEALPFVYAGEPDQGRLMWTWEDGFSRTQHYLGDTNILVTELECSDPALQITLSDLIPAPEPNRPNTALVRTVTIENLSASEFTGAFGHYFDLRLGEVAGKQAVRYDRATGRFLQYFRDIAVVMGGTVPDQVRCGKAGYANERSAKIDLTNGHLNGQPEDIGDVDFAHLFRLKLAPGESRAITVTISFGADLHSAEAILDRLQHIGPDALRLQTNDYWHAYLDRRAPVAVDDDLQGAYKRALLMLAILQDAQTGSFVAAPEFDPQYDHCGGYGYCWPRDASEAADALFTAGYPEALERLVGWYGRAQQPDGLWGQRHWAEGPIAASWAQRDDFCQLDQSAAALLSICQWALAEPGDAKHRIEQNYAAIKAAAGALSGLVDERGYHAPACDLWETFEGIFAYTNAAFSVCLQAAADCARIAGDTASAQEWSALAEKAAAATLALFNGTHFARGLHNVGERDNTVDSATFGLIEPFGIIDLDDPVQRRMGSDNLATIESALGRQIEGGPAIRRYQGDAYLGGTAGCVNTLWAAQVKLHLALSSLTDEPAKARELADSALDYVRTCLHHATPAGCLPELMAAAEFPYWAAPHAWASALLVKCVLAYNKWLQAAASQERA